VILLHCRGWRGAVQPEIRSLPSDRTIGGTSMISKSQEETEVSERLEEKALEAEMRRLG
jgi:hypothetical protein